MATRRLQVWVLDRLLSAQLNLGSLEIDEIRKGWDWKTFHIDLLRSVKDGSAPDVVEIGTTWTNRLTRDGVLLNITQLATEHLNATSTFFPRTLYSCRDTIQVDQYYALPLLADVHLLFYNENYLKSYLADHPNAFKNWRAFEKMCGTLKEDLPHRVIAWPLSGISAFHFVLPWVWTAGGDFITPSHSERTQEALYRLARLVLTDCAPIPPDSQFDTVDLIRIRFMAERIGVMSGSFWMTHDPDWQSRFKATLYPSDLFPAAFIGGSNLAIVRKHGDDENAEAYQWAKEFLGLMVSLGNQINLSKSVGKLPCNILAWKQMRQQEQDKETRAVLETFNDALCYTVDRGMPDLPNFVQIEEELKTCVNAIWNKVGRIKRESSGAALEALEDECREMIRRELTEARKRIEKFLTDYTVQYTSQEVEEIGITPPGQFDLWLEVTDSSPLRGNVYVVGRGQIQKGIGPKPFRILHALANAPERRLSQEKLLEDIWEYKPASDHKSMDEITALAEQLSVLVELFKRSQRVNPNQLLKELQQRGVKPPYSALVSRLGTNPSIDHLQYVVCEVIIELFDQLKYLADHSRRRLARDTLNKTCSDLNEALGQIRDKPVISHSRQDGDTLYHLNTGLSICVVVP